MTQIGSTRSVSVGSCRARIGSNEKRSSGGKPHGVAGFDRAASIIPVMDEFLWGSPGEVHALPPSHSAARLLLHSAVGGTRTEHRHAAHLGDVKQDQ